MIKCGSATFTRDFEYDIVMTNEGICVVNEKYTGEKCLFIKDDQCLLCIEGYYPDKFQVYPYSLDKILPYSTKII